LVEAPVGLVIRPATVDDADDLFRIHQSSIERINPSFYSEKQKNAWRAAVTHESWPTRILELTSFVATIQGEVVGFVAWHDSEIEQIFVAPDFGKLGIGRTLMSFALEKTPVQDMYLVASLNAVEFYEWFGFRPVEQMIRQRGGVDIPCIRMKRPSV
jgi:predicted N-acetyltransferase YhbS